MSAKRKQSVYPCESYFSFHSMDTHQSQELNFLVARYAPTHFVSCESLKSESVIVVRSIYKIFSESSYDSLSQLDLSSVIPSCLSHLYATSSGPSVYEHLGFHTCLALFSHINDRKLELTNCSSCGSTDIRVTGDDNRLQKCGVCKQRKRKAQKLAVRLSSHGMRNDSINVLCEDLVGNHILRTISKDFVGGGGITGRRPTDPHWYVQSSTKSLQSSVLVQIFLDLELLALPITIENGHLFAVAYETYIQKFETVLVSIDRAFTLLMMLKTCQIKYIRCSECLSITLSFINDLSPNLDCSFCDIEHQINVPVRKCNPDQYAPLITLEVTHES